MRTTFVRRTVLTASAMSLALLATACGGTEKADAKPAAEPSAAAPSPSPSPSRPAKGRTDAELGGLILAQADLPSHVVKAVDAARVKEGEGTTTDKPACLPLARAQSFAVTGTPVGTARVSVVAKPKEPGADATAEEKAKAGMDALGSTATVVFLESYEGDGAEQALESLRRSANTCASGFTVGEGEGSLKVTKVGPGAPVGAGDEAHAYTLDVDLDGDKGSMELSFVRKGDVLTVFSSMSLTGVAEQPRDVIKAQTKKLG